MECKNLSVNGSSKSRRSCDSLSILVVDDDTTCLSFVAALLKKFKYEVVTAKHPNDALCALRIKGGGFDLVVSDIHMPDMNGFQLQQVIAHEFNLPVVLMSVDSKEVVVSKGMESGASASLFISKPVSPNDLKDLWQFAVANMRNKRKQQGKINKMANINENYSKRKTAQSECDVNTKKPKLIWTNGLHYRFLEAIRSIGLQRSVPKKILEVMNVPGLTRENVASHLQKYRMFLKRVSDSSYQVDVGDDSRNYSALTLNRLNKPNFGAYSYQKDPSITPIDQERNNTKAANGRIAHNYCQTSPSFHNSNVSVVASTNINNPTIIPPFEISETISALPSAHLGSSGNFHSYELQNSQYLGDSCYVLPNIQQELSDFNGNYQHQLLMHPQPSNLALIQDVESGGGNIVDDSPFCSSAFDIITTQPHHNPLVQLNMQDQLQQQGCEYTESSLLYDGISSSAYDQAAYTQVQGSMDSVKFGNASSQITIALEKCDEDDALESLLAFGPFGEDQIQTLEGI